MESTKKVTASHFYGMTYCGSTVWLNEATTASRWRKLNSIHYWTQRICLEDFRNRHPRQEVTSRTKRATPLQWIKYSNSKMAFNLFHQNEKSTRLGLKLLNKAYIKDRFPGRATLIDESRKKIGRQSFLNRQRSLRCIDFNRTQGIPPDRLRINLKKTFFNQWQLTETLIDISVIHVFCHWIWYW